MPTQSENTKRIAKNTLMLYVRMLFSMLVSLYTSRVVLNALGVEDYGIYNVVGGFVAMFSIVSSSLSSSASRFITFELGRGDFARLKKVFSTSLSTQIALCLIIFILLETIGLWFLNIHFTIPPELSLLLLVGILVQAIYVWYCHNHFSECRSKIRFYEL